LRSSLRIKASSLLAKANLPERQELEHSKMIDSIIIVYFI
jgi:hypothetical protein